MSLEKKFTEINFKIQDEVEQEIANIRKGISNKSEAQMDSILKELQMMREEKGRVLYFPRTIVDSWDFSDELGMKLMGLSDMYRRLT